MAKKLPPKVPFDERNVQLGDVFLTRNFNEEDNSSPGYWNHAAMYAGNGIIVEAQAGPNAVIETPFEEFWKRYPEILILRYKYATPPIQHALASAIKSYIGVPYRKIASIFFVLRRAGKGENCTSIVRKAFKDVFGKDPKWKLPDTVLENNLFLTVDYKDDRDFWEYMVDII